MVGFGGLSVLPTKHEFDVGGRSLYTWCAWDSLFIPEILGQTAQVKSPCAETGHIVSVAISPNGAATADPHGVVLSFTLPDLATMRADVRASFCELVFFFESLDAAKSWARRNDGTFILTLEQAVEVGKRKNAAQFGEILAPGASPPGTRA